MVKKFKIAGNGERFILLDVMSFLCREEALPKWEGYSVKSAETSRVYSEYWVELLNEKQKVANVYITSNYPYREANVTVWLAGNKNPLEEEPQVVKETDYLYSVFLGEGNRIGKIFKIFDNYWKNSTPTSEYLGLWFETKQEAVQHLVKWYKVL